MFIIPEKIFVTMGTVFKTVIISVVCKKGDYI